MVRDRVTVNKAVINKVPVDSLEKLYRIFDELACSHEYSEEHGELHITVGDSFMLSFYADPVEMREIAESEYWANDAEGVAEGYWKQ
jgi:hypothetical protein